MISLDDLAESRLGLCLHDRLISAGPGHQRPVPALLLRHTPTSRVHYLCHWQGYGTDVDSYEPLDNIPQQARGMVRDFNKQQRERENGAGASGAKSSKRSAK